MKSLFFSCGIICLIISVSYSQTKALKFKFNHTANGEPLVLDETIFTIDNGKKMKLTRAEFYLSGVSLFTSDTDSFRIADSYVLVNAQDRDVLYSAGNYPSDYNFNKITMNVGIDPDKNHGDPTLYPPSHPLGPKSPDMHWGWAAGYRFMAIDGVVDNNNDGIPEMPFQIHSLGDELLFRALLDFKSNGSNDLDNLEVTLDYSKLFNGLTMKGSVIEHGKSDINKKLLVNAVDNGFFTPIIISNSEDLVQKDVATIDQHNRLIYINIENPITQINVDVYNLFGQSISHNILHESHSKLELSLIPSGIYILQVSTGNKKQSKIIVIQ